MVTPSFGRASGRTTATVDSAMLPRSPPSQGPRFRQVFFDRFSPLKKLFCSRPDGRQPRSSNHTLLFFILQSKAEFSLRDRMASSNAQETKPVPASFDAAVFGATVQLPAFDKVEPETWFTVADANFALRKVTDANTKYYYVLSKLDASTLRKLSAFLKRPRSADPYQDIRRQLCRTYEPPMEQKLNTLLAICDMGDERPMEFALELQRLAAEATVDDF